MYAFQKDVNTTLNRNTSRNESQQKNWCSELLTDTNEVEITKMLKEMILFTYVKRGNLQNTMNTI